MWSFSYTLRRARFKDSYFMQQVCFKVQNRFGNFVMTNVEYETCNSLIIEQSLTEFAGN